MATLKDRAMQALYLLALEPIAETRADPNSYGFRPGRSSADAIGHLHQVLSLPTGAQWIFEGDIHSCFDEISHEWLLTHIPMETSILRQWLTAGFREQSRWQGTEAGTPQGAICSPVLANLTLDGLEAKLRERYPEATRCSRRAKVNLVRFADDFVITGSSKELLETEVRPLVEQFLHERGLVLSPEKTKITHITDGFDFLGQHLRDYHGTILVKPSRARVHSLLAKARALIRANAQAKPGNLIEQLNPLIRGWAYYHRHVASKQTFAKVDHAIFRSLWQRAKRRHPNKPRRWITDKYFQVIGNRHGVFCGDRQGKAGRSHRIELFSAASVPIKRHTKIEGAANPFDPAWEVYLEQRLGVTHGRQPAGSTEAAVPVAGTTRSLSGLSSGDYAPDGMAQPSSPVAQPRGLRPRSQSRSPTPQLPSTSASPGSAGCEAAFLTECLKGLSGMPGNWHVPF
jgi:RNA-directed DNA polymerase